MRKKKTCWRLYVLRKICRFLRFYGRESGLSTSKLQKRGELLWVQKSPLLFWLVRNFWSFLKLFDLLWAQKIFNVGTTIRFFAHFLFFCPLFWPQNGHLKSSIYAGLRLKSPLCPPFSLISREKKLNIYKRIEKWVGKWPLLYPQKIGGLFHGKN